MALSWPGLRGRWWRLSPAFAPFLALSLVTLSTCAQMRTRSPEAVAQAIPELPGPTASSSVASDSGPARALAPDGLPAAAIDAAVADAIASASLPGAVVVAGRHDEILFRRAYGEREVEPEHVPMTLDTVFDLASVTKPLATATSVMVLVDRGAVGLDDPLVKYVPECDREDKRAITLRHLLLHTAAFPADIAKEDFAHGRTEAIRRICNTPLRGAPGTVSIYSDLGFMLLEEVVRRVTSRELPDFAAETVFAPLGMRDTGFLPPPALQRRAAWTENVDGIWRVGVVHDPRAYLLGGVAGHAGLFATADDVARYARMILNGGELDGKRVLSAHAVATMTAPHDVPGGIHALGWMMESQWRGQGLSPTAFGHFGFTGTSLWIDPDKDLFVVVLTNRVHPDGKGDSKPLVARVDTLVARAVGPPAGKVLACVGAPAEVQAGVDVLREQGFQRLRGRRVGLITNNSARARDGTSTVDVLRSAPGVQLVALFTPEHGLDATHEGKVDGGVDARTGLPIYSLYGDSFSPTAESLDGIDTLVFDIQDVGTRFFTYASTMRRAMIAAAAHDLRFVVLDRPNPIDGIDVAGPVLMPTSGSGGSFVNYHSLPVRHGMTLGELATLLNADDHLGVALSVVTMHGWHRSLYGDQTGLPWVNPSPNLRSVDEAVLYPAVGLLEATNLSVGRGTDTPFEELGAPWIDGGALSTALATAATAERLAGVAFAPFTFVPRSDRYANQPCGGVRITVTNRGRFEPVQTGLMLAREIRRLYPREWEFEKLSRLLLHPDTMRAIDGALPLGAIVDTYRTELAAFIARREKYLLYADGKCE